MIAKTQTRLPKDATLDQQILMVEQRLLQRRASSASHLALFRWQLRQKMTSPLVLLLAGGIGFAMGPSTGSKSARPSAAASAGSAAVRFLPTMLSMVSLTGSVMTLVERFRAETAPAKSAAAPAVTAVDPSGKPNTAQTASSQLNENTPA